MIVISLGDDITFVKRPRSFPGRQPSVVVVPDSAGVFHTVTLLSMFGP